MNILHLYDYELEPGRATVIKPGMHSSLMWECDSFIRLAKTNTMDFISGATFVNSKMLSAPLLVDVDFALHYIPECRTKQGFEEWALNKNPNWDPRAMVTVIEIDIKYPWKDTVREVAIKFTDGGGRTPGSTISKK